MASSASRVPEAVPRVIARRPPPQLDSGRQNFMRYGVGHVGFAVGDGYGYSGPPSHPHVAAIEVALHHHAFGEVPYTLMGMNIPLSEVLATFLDDVGLAKEWDEWVLEYEGRRLEPKESPQSLGLDPFQEWPVAVFQVVEVGSKKMMALFGAMNRLGAALRIDRSGAETQRFCNVDGLGFAFSLLDLEELYPVSRACVLWHNVSQRLSLLRQLQCSAPPAVEYPAYLKLIGEFSSRLDHSTCRARAQERLQWASLGLRKESDSASQSKKRSRPRWDRPAMFTKAAGCTTMRTVQVGCPKEALWRQTLPLRSTRTQFMIEELTQREIEEDGRLTSKRAFFGELEDASQRLEAVDVATVPESLQQAKAGRDVLPEQPPEVVRIVDASLRRMSVELFRKYFSPSMHFIFPLIAHQQALHGLDFTTTQTWGVRCAGADVGAVAWRVRKPLLAAHVREASQPPDSILEVLFISVWEEYRHSDCGQVLVGALEEEARNSGCGFMYVEIGHEQPLARRFWGKSGFRPARDLVTKEQSVFFEHACLRFADTEQFVKKLCA